MARRAVVLLLALGSGLPLAGSAKAYTSAGPIAVAIQNLFWAITFFAVIVAVVVFSLLAYFIVRYRRSVHPTPATEMEGNRALEVTWTVIPAIILVTILVLAVPVLVYTDTIPTPDTTVRVIGQQFVWTFQYADGTNSTPDLWIQQDIVVRLEVTSMDVIHSFSVPDLGVKIDAFPGRLNTWWMEATVPGDYLIQCAELCGVGHYGMRGVLHVFKAGTQPRIYGPPPKPLEVTNVQMLESGGNASAPWSLTPRNLTFGIGSAVTLRIWNNNTAPHDFRVDAPINASVPAIPPFGSAWLNFTIENASVAPIPYGPSDLTARGRGMEGNLTIASGELVDIYLDDANAGPGHSWSVRPDPLKLPDIGEVYTLRIHNIGSIPHNFGMSAPYANITYVPLILPGQTVYVGPFVVVTNAMGTYQCDVPGHAAAGMRATYITGRGGGAPPAGVPVYDMMWITVAVGVPVTLAYVIRHARRPET